VIVGLAITESVRLPRCRNMARNGIASYSFELGARSPPSTQ
jgi:hypothetical protein